MTDFTALLGRALSTIRISEQGIDLVFGLRREIRIFRGFELALNDGNTHLDVSPATAPFDLFSLITGNLARINRVEEAGRSMLKIGFSKGCELSMDLPSGCRSVTFITPGGSIQF